jgi:hypothetical protein
MARFRKRAKRRNYGGFTRKSRGRSTSSGISATDILLAGAIYGVARPRISALLPDLFNIGPVTSDNAIIGAAGYMASKQSNKLIKAVGLMAMGGEAGIITSNATQSIGTQSSGSYIYG